jgi:hypothetical protein
LLAQTKKQNQQQNRGVMAHKALTTMLLSNSYPFLANTQGRIATNWWNLRKIGGAIAWQNETWSA